MHRVEIDRRGVAWLTLARPEVHNAFNDTLIAELTRSLETLGADPQVRAVVLAAEGKSFSAGADLNWMKAMAGYDEAQNLADARKLSQLLWTLDRLPKPTIGRVQGAALGGGVGLAACCDIVVASRNASFTLSEVKLGLIPATIGPYVVAAIGQRASRRFFLTAERISADEALRLGLLHRVVEPEGLDAAIEELLAALLANGPAAVAAAKALVFAAGVRPVDAAMMDDTAGRIAAIRASPEGREGIGAFLEKRKPDWRR
jgi:methylglutaconyl-CoA hydratase